MSVEGWVIWNEREDGYLSEPDDTVYVDLLQAYRFKTQKEAQDNINNNDDGSEVVKKLELFVVDPKKTYKLVVNRGEREQEREKKQASWLPVSDKPKKYKKYLVCRKNGSQHWVTWNGTGWAHGEGEWVRWFNVPEPPKEI